MDISYLLGRSSQTHPSGDTGPYATDIIDFSLEASAQRLRHYRDIQLPGMTGKVPPLKELTHPSKLNKRSHSVKVGGEGVELEEEPSRQRRRFDNAEVKGYLAGLKRKQMLLRQDSNPQEVPCSPLLPLHPSSSSTGFGDGEVSGEYLSLHDNELALEPQSGHMCTKELISTTREDTKRSYGDSFPSPTVHPPLSIVSELDPSLQHLLGGTMSPAVASTPSPTTTSRSLARSPPIQQLHRHLHASEEVVTDIIGGGGQEETPESTSVNVAGGEDQELVEDLSEMPILPSFSSQRHLHTSPTLPYILPNDPPPPSLSLLLSQAFSSHNQSTSTTYPSQRATSNLRSDTRETHDERFNATTFSISHYYPREE